MATKKANLLNLLIHNIIQKLPVNPISKNNHY